MRKNSLILMFIGIQLLSSVPTFSQWQKMAVSSYANSLAENKNTIYIGGYKGFYRATRSNSTWLLDSSMNDIQINTIVANDNGVIVGSNQGVFVSKDGGGTWHAADSGLADLKASLICTSGSELFANTTAGLFLSTNFGSSWTKTLDSGLATPAIRSMTCFDDVIFVGSPSSGVFRSTNKGRNWSACNKGLPKSIVWQDSGVYVSAIYASNGMLLVGVWGGDITYDDGRVYISSDGGNNWRYASAGIFNCKISRFLLHNNNIFAVTSAVSNEGKVYLSTDEGAKWEQIAFSHGWTKDIAFCDSSLIVSAADGVWVSPMSYIVTAVNHQSILPPFEYCLFQNYPNPFNPVTKILFSNASKSNVTLNVLDIFGREIAVLLKQAVEPGTHEVEFDGSRYPSGTYFIRMEAKGFSQIKKCVLIK